VRVGVEMQTVGITAELAVYATREASTMAENFMI
jgi:hypothetical protein